MRQKILFQANHPDAVKLKPFCGMQCHELKRISFRLGVLKTLGFLNLKNEVVEISLDNCCRVGISVGVFMSGESVDDFLYRLPTLFLLPLVLKFLFKILLVIRLLKNMLERL